MLYFCEQSPISQSDVAQVNFTDEKEEVQSATTNRDKDSFSQEKDDDSNFI
jgi:hypothetical protein